MSKCEHVAVGRVKCRDFICVFPMLLNLCRGLARVYWVGTLPPPKTEVLKILECFEKHKYCPKCGAKLDFESLKGL